MPEPTPSTAACRPLLDGRTAGEKIWRNGEIPLALMILSACWGDPPLWMRLTFTVAAAITIFWVLFAAWVDVLYERERARIDGDRPTDTAAPELTITIEPLRPPFVDWDRWRWTVEGYGTGPGRYDPTGYAWFRWWAAHRANAQVRQLRRAAHRATNERKVSL